MPTSHKYWGRTTARCLAPLLGVAALALAPPGAAAPSSDAQAPETRPHPKRIEIHVDGPESAVLLVRDTATELLHRHGVRVDVLGPSDHTLELDDTPLAIATLRLRDDRCSLLIMDGVGNEIDKRDLSQQSSVETSIEAAAHIIYFVVDTLIEDQQSGKSQSARSTSPEARATPPRSRPRSARSAPNKPATTEDVAPTQSAYDLAAFFSATSLGESRTLPGGGISAAARWQTPVEVGVLVTGSTHVASEIEYQGASAWLRPTSLKVLAALELPTSHVLSVSLAAGPGVTWLSVAPDRSTSEVEARGSRTLVEPVFSLAGGLRVNLGSHTFLSALGGIDMSLAQQRFVAEDVNQRQLLLSTPRIRPLFMLAAGASFIGPSGFSTHATDSP